MRLFIRWTPGTSRLPGSPLEVSELCAVQVCPACRFYIGRELQAWMLVLGPETTAQEVRHNAGLSYLARAVPVHAVCVRELTSDDLDRLARDTLALVLGT